MADYVYPELLNKYEFRNYGHALEILSEVSVSIHISEPTRPY